MGELVEPTEDKVGEGGRRLECGRVCVHSSAGIIPGNAQKSNMEAGLVCWGSLSGAK